MYRAILEIPCKDAEIIEKVLEVEEGDEFLADARAEKDKLIIEIKAERISMLQAGINSYLRAVKAVIG